MKKALFLMACIQAFVVSAQKINYPVTRTMEHTDTYFGTVVPDPYRWLEDDRSAETGEWVKAQNAVTEKYLSAIPFRKQVKDRLTALWNFPKSSSPFKGGKNYFVYTNNGLQNQFVLNILRGGIEAKPEVFLDPNTMSKDGTVSISSVSVSNDGKYLAYAMSSAGSDWQEIRVRNTDDGKELSDRVQWVKFSAISWKGDGFYYSRYDAPDSADILKGSNRFHKIYYHKVGEPQSKDKLVFENKEHPQRNFYATVTDDESFLIVYGSEGTSGTNMHAKDLRDEKSNFVEMVKTFDKDFTVIDNEGNKLIVLTNSGAPRYRIVSMDTKNPSAEWQTIIAESKDVIQEAGTTGDFIVCNYMVDATSNVKLFNRDGSLKTELELEDIGTVDQLSGSRKDDKLFYAFTTFTSPSTIYQYNVKTGEQKPFFKPAMDFDASQYQTKQVFYTSKDGTKIPMFIVHKIGIKRDGTNPTMIYGYGGFNNPQMPQFKIERLVFLEQGGILAVPNLRGGGEYGEEWHAAGKGLKRQNVFDDCIAAAEYLISEKYTNPGKLAVSGRSNGGLLVGAVMTQRPDLFRVALPAVGVMDMLRYHTFTIGWAWKGDYGSSENEADFKNLYAYSPLHNIRENVNYPATFVTTGDHDDRVVPAHSFKFIATLQKKYTGNNPVLIRIDVDSGHASTTALGSSKPVAKQIDEQTDVFSFMMYNLGMNYMDF